MSENANPMAEAAADYIARCWRPIRIKERLKEPRSRAWQNSDPAPENFGATENVGVILGPASDNLVDIDLDCPEARRVAALPALLGDLPAFGRASHDAPGHRLVVCPNLPEVEAKVHQLKNGDNSVVMEVRAGKGFTVMPPSEHEDRIVWQHGAAPATIPEMEWDRLQLLARLTGLLALALRHYPNKGGRDNYCMHVGGALMHLGVPGETGDELLRGLATLAGDEEVDMRASKCSAAWSAKESGENVTGLPRLIEDHLDPKGGKALRRWLGQGEQKAEPLPAGALFPGDHDIHNFCDLLQGEFIARAPELIFRRADQLVRVRALDQDEQPRDGVRRHEGATEIAPVRDVWLNLKASRLGIVFAKRTAKGPVRIAPGGMPLLLAAPEETRFPIIKGLSTTPTLNRDEPGYDKDSQLFLAFPPDLFPPIPVRPTKEQARAALDRLARPLREFPFEGADGADSTASRSVILSAILSGVVRGEMETCPLHGISAPVPGTGKTMLGDFVAAIVTGRQPDLMDFTADTDEMSKRLGALMLRGSTLVNIDNVSAPLGGDFLNGILTSPTWDVRVLGESKMVKCDTRLLVMATGNNLSGRGDMVRRLLICRLNAEMEQPDSRRFDFDPVEEARASRGQMVADALTVLRAYDAAGRPLPDTYAPLGSFDDWGLVRGALLWLGEVDPVDTRRRSAADDEQREMMFDILEMLRGKFTAEPFTVARLHGECDDTARELIGSYLKDGKWNRAKAGRRLKLMVDHPCGRLVLRAEIDPKRNAQEYRVEDLTAGEAEEDPTPERPVF